MTNDKLKMTNKFIISNSKLGIWILSFIWILVLGICHSSIAGVTDPLRIGGSARSIAMGRTSNSAPGRLDNMYGNPANIAKIESFRFASMQVKVAEDVNYTFIGTGLPTRFGKLALGYLGSGVAGINQTTKDANGRIISTGTFDYSNTVMNLAWGKNINDRLSIGTNLKLYSQSFSGITGGSASGNGFDIGTLFKVNNGFNIGLGAQNILLNSMTWGTNEKELFPTTIRLGLSFYPRDNLTTAFDFNSYSDSPSEIRAGAEWQLNNLLALRGGAEIVPSAASGNITNLTMGIGLSRNGFAFDYAYYLDSTLADNSTHYMSIGFKLPEPVRTGLKPVPTKAKPIQKKTQPTTKKVRTDLKPVPKKKTITTVILTVADRKRIAKIERYIEVLKVKKQYYKKSKQAFFATRISEERLKIINILKKADYPPKITAKARRINNYITLLQTKIVLAKKNARKAKLRTLISIERARLITVYKQAL